MPYKFDKIPINNEKHDKRVKLTTEDKENIVKEYATGAISIHGLARKYGVSKRTIQFTLFPERKEKAKQQYAERQKDGRYYDKKKHNEHMKRHRDHKKNLYKQGLLKSKEE
jgi:transposase-like protein